MTLQFACGDMMPGCPTTLTHVSQDELFSALSPQVRQVS